MGRERRSWRVTGVLLVAVALVALGSAAASASPAAPSVACVPRATAPKPGISEVSQTQVSDRLLELHLRSNAMQDVQSVYVLLPQGYVAGGARRYPVLYLLHGALGSYKDWIANGVEGVLGDAPYIVVMPDDGEDGSYSDWYGLPPGVSGAVPAWETYHLDELVPFIDRTFPTLADRSHRFVAGLSSGGGGATKYAAERPGLFGAVGSFSGAVDTDLDYPSYALISEALWNITLLPGYGPDAHCTWGDPATQRVVWRDNTATPMAENLRGTPLFLASGNGQPGPYDATAPYVDPTEAEVWSMNQQLVAALDADHIAHTDYFYGPGHHSWPYWLRDLRVFLTWLAPKVGAPVPVPSPFSYHTARAAFVAWGWGFAAHRDVIENTYLTAVTRKGLTVTGSGTLGVITPPLYVPGRAFVVGGTGHRQRSIRAGRHGRLRFSLNLGPSHQAEQTAFGPGATSGWRKLTVHIRPR